MLPTPQFFYFDMGNVLLSFSHERGFFQMAAVAGVEASRVAIFFAANDRQLLYEAGHISTEDLISEFQKTTGSQSDREELLLAAGDIFTPIPETIALLPKLQAAGCRLGLLSNTCDAHWRVCTDGRFPFLQEAFETIVLSFEERVAKPDAEIYRIAAERCGVEPERIFFVDDRPENVEAARAIGFDAVLFVGPEVLFDDLRERGVKV